MSKLPSIHTALLFLCLLPLASCGPGPTPQPSIPLEGTEWVLSSLRGDEIVPGKSWTLGFFPDDYMEGKAGCNTFGTQYTASGQDFHVSEIHRTDSTCDEPGVAAQEQAFFEALASIAAYRAGEDRLEFEGPSGKAVLVYSRKLPPAVDPALKDSEWLLTSLRGEALLADTRITLNLGAEEFTGISGCNEYRGEYEAADKGVLLTSNLIVTAMLCKSPEGIMEQEGSYVGALSGSATYRLAEGRLEVANDRGETVLVFARQEQFELAPGALLGTAWRLVSVDGEGLSEGAIVSLDFFSDAVFGGHLGCRDYLISYELSGDNLTMHSGSSFDPRCETWGEAPRQESQAFSVLSGRADLRLAAGQLTVLGERGTTLVFEPLPEEENLGLEGATWSLLAFVGPNPYMEKPDPWPFPLGVLPETTADLGLEGGAARGSAGCNSYRGTYSRAGSSLSFAGIAATEKACPDPPDLMKQEARYLALLPAVTAYHVYGDLLWLGTGDGQALVFFASGR